MKKVTLFVLLFVVFSSSAFAEDTSIVFWGTRPIQELAMIVSAKGLSISIDPDVEATYTLVGRFTPQDALEQVVASNHLGLVEVKANTFRIMTLENFKTYQKFLPPVQLVNAPDPLGLSKKSEAVAGK